MAPSSSKPAPTPPRASAPPTDFSPRAVTSAVLRESLQRPHVLYPTAIGLLGGLAAVVLGPATMFVAPAVAGLTLAAGGWLWDYGFRRDQRAHDYLQRQQRALAGHIEDSIAVLEKELDEIGNEDALSQLTRLRATYRGCEELLRRKLNPGEMTYSRYLGMVEQVFLAGLDNLNQVSDTLRGIAVIDEARTRKRLDMAAPAEPTLAQTRERTALQERLDLLQTQRQKVQNWLAENEGAMTQMDRFMAALADMDTAQDYATMEMAPAMEELGRLLDRAHVYGSTPAAPPTPMQSKH